VRAGLVRVGLGRVCLVRVSARAGRGLVRGLPLVALLLVATPLWGQTPVIRTDVDTTVVYVGDPITLGVVVDHPADAQVVWPDSLELGPFEILGAQVLPPTAQGDNVRSSLALLLAAYELGDLEIPSFEVEVVGPGDESTLLHTDRFGIRVESVGLDETGDIRDLKGPLGIPLSATTVGLWALALLVAAGLAWAIYRFTRRRGEGPEGAVPALPSRPPHEVALESLERLEASPLLDRGEVKEYHIQVSDILRTYVEGRFRVPALEMTTEDITAGLRKAGVDSGVRDRFGSFLYPCDMVKFAKSRPDAAASQAVLAQGRELVEETIREQRSAEAVAVEEATPQQRVDAATPQGPGEEGS